MPKKRLFKVVLIDVSTNPADQDATVIAQKVTYFGKMKSVLTR